MTLIQAVGAWIVGRLVVLRETGGAPSLSSAISSIPFDKELWAILAVFLTYGVGMASNDCADALIDGQDLHSSVSTKSQRAIASGRISTQQGWIFVAGLSLISLLIAFGRVSTQFGLWCMANLVVMLTYALGLQKLLFVKNALVGWLCISPLWGATTMTVAAEATTRAAAAAAIGSTRVVMSSNGESLLRLKMDLLAAIGFSLGVAREILKDIQDVDLDRGNKSTLPLVMGSDTAHTLSFGILGGTLILLQSRPYRNLFSSSYLIPVYSMGWALGMAMYIRAIVVPTIKRQQAWVKRMIYVLLLSLIGSILTQ